MTPAVARAVIVQVIALGDMIELSMRERGLDVRTMACRCG